MRIDWRVAAGLLVVVGAALGIALAILLGQASDGGATARYEVTVQFSSSVTQDDIGEVGALLRSFDEDVEFLVMEIFPPIGRAILATDVPDFCRTVQAELEAESYVDSASCRPWQEPDEAEPDAPVSTDNDANS
jgi:hypothetical protein